MEGSERNLDAPDVGGPLKRRLRAETVARRAVDFLSRFSPDRRNNECPLPPDLRIGVLLQWGVGDAVLTLPLLTGLRNAMPQANIELIGKPWLKSLFLDTGLCDTSQVLVPPWTRHSRKYSPGTGAWRRFLKQLWNVRKSRFDLVISCRFDARDILQLKLLRTSARAGFGGAGGARWLDVDLGFPPSRVFAVPAHRDAAFALTRITGSNAPDVPRFPPNAAATSAARVRLEAAGYRSGPLVALSTSAGHPIRRWEPARFAEVLRQTASEIGFLVVIKDPTEPEAEPLPIPAGLGYAEWSGSLAELRALFSLTDVVLCCDSGVMHIASACGAQIVAIFGPGSADWYGPYGADDRVVLQEPMPCRPCFDRCIYAEPICMTGISVDQVVTAMRGALYGSRAGGRDR